MPHWMPPAGIAMRLEAHFADRMVHCFADRIHDIYDLLSNAAQTRPQGEAVILGGIRLTYAALLAQVEQVAAGLAMRGIRQGDRVALLMGNHLEFVITCLAAFRLGAIAVPIGHRLQAPEVAYILEHCGAALVVFEAGLADRIPPADTGPRLRVCLSSADIVPEGSETFTDLRTVTAPLPERPVVAEEDTAVILYTSGTTGRPKGAMLTHFNLSHSLLHFQYGMDLGPEDRLLLAVPASHVTGLVAVILLSLQVKATLIMMPEFTARAFLRLAAAERMTHSISCAGNVQPVPDGPGIHRP